MTRRGLFRIHLSTAIVLTAVAGGLLGLNLRERFIESHESTPVDDGSRQERQVTKSWATGWPLDAEYRVQESGKPIEKLLFVPFAVINFGIAILLIAGIVLILEWLVRRREVR